ncbi:hypothetical protein [Streptomyces roseolilacinus]|uniref:Uncharacterized protein n=1 Tax=Streptomyces roseolilacinus TaxID=66904 RepID=A0A918B2L9_9ACTN|nr:hypothetical protein [Streptomyces roseolilacinus]GGQ18757.1 hypothetical protein GCM10010249_41740 [Streptomyces roseolilacinus]
MRETGDTRIDAVPVGATDTAGPVRAVAGGRLAVRAGGRVEVYGREAFLAGAREPLAGCDLPDGAHAEPAADGGFVVAEASRVRAVTADGTTRWEVPHDTWHGGHRPPRAPGAPAPGPRGRFVAVTVPTLLPGDGAREREVLVDDGPPRRGYGRDRLLLLDAATGAVLDERPVAAVSGAVALRWRADGAVLAASFWTAWYGWAGCWLEASYDGLRVLGAGLDRHEAAAFVPGTSRLVTMRRAEGMSLDDDRYELALHDVHDPSAAAVLDLNDLSWEPEDDDFDHVYALDARHLLVTADWVPPRGPLEPTHWLLAADTLRPLGRLRYPRPVGNAVTALGDGTWLTHDAGRLHRWRLG